MRLGWVGAAKPQASSPQKVFIRQEKSVFKGGSSALPLTQSIEVENLYFCVKGRLRLLYAELREKPAWAKFSGGGENFAYFLLLGQNITIIA